MTWVLGIQYVHVLLVSEAEHEAGWCGAVQGAVCYSRTTAHW